MKSEKSRVPLYFFLLSIIITIIVFIIVPGSIIPIFNEIKKMLMRIIPVLILVFVLLVITNYLMSPEKLVKYLSKKSWKTWALAVVAGIISTGPIFAWYPLLNELQKHGARNGMIAVFLYNRAIKLALLPMMIVYFGLKYVVVLGIVMIIMSIIQGLIIEKMEV